MKYKRTNGRVVIRTGRKRKQIIELESAGTKLHKVRSTEERRMILNRMSDDEINELISKSSNMFQKMEYAQYLSSNKPNNYSPDPEKENIDDKEVMPEKKTMSFNIYAYDRIYLDGEIEDGCLTLVSNVFGKDYDSEKTYFFSKEQTEKLFGIISLDGFIELCRKEDLIGMEEFLKKNSIQPGTYIW